MVLKAPMLNWMVNLSVINPVTFRIQNVFMQSCFIADSVIVRLLLYSGGFLVEFVECAYFCDYDLRSQLSFIDCRLFVIIQCIFSCC